jgi:hypothetical protein
MAAALMLESVTVRGASYVPPGGVNRTGSTIPPMTLIVYAALATDDGLKPGATTIALIVTVPLETSTGAEYFGELVFGCRRSCNR